MTAFTKDPWGRLPVSGRPSDQPTPSRRARLPAATLPAPGEASSSRPSSGAGFCVLTVALSDATLMLLRLIGAHDACEDEGELVSRLIAARAEAIGIAALADHAIPCERASGRGGMPSGAAPLPRAPP